jgi:hypothetical protein
MNLNRRSFLRVAGIGIGTTAMGWSAPKESQTAIVRQIVERSFSAAKAHTDPFNEVTLDVIVAGPDGVEQCIPGFWAGGAQWRFRHNPVFPGHYTYRTICSDAGDGGLHGRKGSFDAVQYSGSNPLYQHGSIRVAADRRHFEHADGTPFFWLGDTNWMGLCERLSWHGDFQKLTSDRVDKGFTVVQLVAGLYSPDLPPFDTKGANEAGFPWKQDYSTINPAYFDLADLRIAYLASRGLVPCIVGTWGFFLHNMGIPKMKQHWRYLIARWAAHPVVWCLAGETTALWYEDYQSPNFADKMLALKHGWTNVARYVRSVDPYHHILTTHPIQSARDSVEDSTVLDFDMLQTGHGDRNCIPNAINMLNESLKHTPKMPVLVGEVCYEGLAEQCGEEVQRFLFWSSILSGAAGHTYGANGIWQVNQPTKPFGPSPYIKQSWGDTPWDVAAQLPGSRQLGLAKSFLSRFSWWRLEPSPQYVEPNSTQGNFSAPYAASVPNGPIFVYTPIWFLADYKVHGLKSGSSYRAIHFNPKSGKERDVGTFKPDSSGQWIPIKPPQVSDWVLMIEEMT